MTNAAGYASKKVLAFPYGENNKPAPPLILPVVSGAEITGYLPAKSTDNGDGTASLAVDSSAGATPITWGAPGFAAVGVANTVVLAANANRKGVMIVNDSPNVVYLAFGANAVANRGVRLNPNGGQLNIGSGNLTTQAINGIATAAGSNVTVIEAT